MTERMYEDYRGWKYRVMRGLGENDRKARYQKPGRNGRKCMARMPWRKTREEAQADLDAMAKERHWQEAPAEEHGF